MWGSSKSLKPEKNKKYDRQLRLWGDHGQTQLESSNVLLIGAGATGTEVLKNLVLPCVQSYTILDDRVVQTEDLGNNFFLTTSQIGKMTRGEAVHANISSLNEEVRGSYSEESIESLLENNLEYFDAFSIVIVTELKEKLLLKLADLLWRRSVPLLICRSYGMLGYLRVVIREHTIVESHPENSRPDLRLDCPFLELQEFCESCGRLEEMTKKEHSHTPWLVVLYQVLEEYLREKPFPKTFREKGELKERIRRAVRRNEDGVPEEEENFEEAVNAVNTAIVPTEVPSHIKQLFEDPSCLEISKEGYEEAVQSGSTRTWTPFWLLLRAVKDFVAEEGEGRLPLRGTLPDMTSDSERYLRLQTVYRERARRDVEMVEGHVTRLCERVGLRITEDSRGFDPSYIRRFCKNASFLRVIRCRSLEEEYASPNIDKLNIRVDGEANETVWYLLLRAADRFQALHGHWPGQIIGNSVHESTSDFSDLPELRSIANKLLVEWGVSQEAGPFMEDCLQEMCRFGGAELHSVAAFMGGVAAQEAIKLLTGQFVPIHQGLLYNAMLQTTSLLDV